MAQSGSPEPAKQESGIEGKAEMAREMEETYYAHVSRYSTSAFMRMKLGKILTRTVALHGFETRVDAPRFLARVRARQ